MAIGKTPVIYAGDGSDVWEVGHRLTETDELADLDENYSCRIGIMESESFAARPVTDKNSGNTRFRASLTPAETLALGVGVWTVGIEISNPTTSPPLVKEVHRKIHIRPQAVKD